MYEENTVLIHQTLLLLHEMMKLAKSNNARYEITVWSSPDTHNFSYEVFKIPDNDDNQENEDY